MNGSAPRQSKIESCGQIKTIQILYQHRQEEEVFAKELKKVLDEAARDLPPRLRELFELLCQGGPDTEEIAKRMGIKPDSVSRLRRRLLDKVIEFIESKAERGQRSTPQAPHDKQKF